MQSDITMFSYIMRVLVGAGQNNQAESGTRTRWLLSSIIFINTFSFADQFHIVKLHVVKITTESQLNFLFENSAVGDEEVAHDETSTAIIVGGGRIGQVLCSIAI